MKNKLFRTVSFLFCAIFSASIINAAIIPAGSGSYTTTFPGTDAAGRNSYPSGTPQLSGNAQGKPVPTNDWWSKLIKENHADNLFNYLYTLKTINTGLIVSYIPFGVIDDLIPVTVGVSGLSAAQTTVSDYSDWTVTINWSNRFEATVGLGMPFLYFTKNASDEAVITITSGTVTLQNEMLIIANAKNGASFVAYAPAGSVWIKNGNTYTSNLNGKNYWSMAILPVTTTNVTATANEYKKYAYVFPKDTQVAWNYNENTSVLHTDFTVTTDVKEGAENKVLLGLLPHQWAHLAPVSPTPDKLSYKVVRGEIKTLAANSFSTENTFHGILPTLPYVDNYSSGFIAAQLQEKLEAMKNDPIGEWTDSYNDGQLLNRLIQSARIADETGNTGARNAMLATIKARVENWLKAETGEVAFLFYYNSTWSAMLGYPAGHGQDNNLNDHHFHWGYFIHAAAFLEQYQPGWAAQWGEMVNLLVRDAASNNRNDALFPFLRNFSPYAGHAWANGFATFPQGNDQESSSESMQFNSALIHWGAITGNKAVRDLGIYLYTTEQTAIDEYWFDMYDRIFPSTQQYRLVSRIWGNSFDNGTFWTGDIAASYGIELYPIHGGSFYLAHNPEYVTKLWNEIKKNTGIMQNQANDNLWHDVMWQYAAFINPSEVIPLYDSYPGRSLKFGVSDAQTYYWLHAMNVLGKFDASITADYPVAVAFNQNGRMTYVAHNYGSTAINVKFSDGYVLNVPARKMAYANAGSTLPVVTITSPANNTKFMLGQPVTITANASDFDGGTIQKVDFYNNNVLIQSDATAPYGITYTPSKEGVYTLVAKATNNSGKTGVSQNVSITVSTETVCKETSTEAEQGSFTKGYVATFETIGTSVEFTCELLDDDRDGVIAYLWTKSPFSERAMTRIEGNKFGISLSGQTIGQTIEIACKFAYAGGMAVTKYFSYEVGVNCGSLAINEIALSPEVYFYPNPVKNQLEIRCPEENNLLTITDLRGNKCLTQHIGRTASIPVGALPAGVYFVQITHGKGIVVKKIIKL
ncbi:MAG: T9SS type A sorting domain-containing protein [Dysgonamonadaceae bacterium]|jgi:endoglucanase Acf2|nr:T9SS type A sorting domain-containing protein [Dysgonamonadaceae bacterium]